MKTETTAINIDRGKGDFFYPEAHVRDAGVGLSERTIHYIANVKEDPDWVRDFRLRALRTFWVLGRIGSSVSAWRCYARTSAT